MARLRNTLWGAALAATVLLPVTGRAEDPDFGQPMAGEYQLDPGHTRLLFRVSHLGFSNYTAEFTDVSATLAFDPDQPAAMRLTARVAAASLETHYPDPALDFNGLLTGPDVLDAAQFPEITFASTEVRPTGATSAEVVGDLTLHGVTQPVTLAVTYNGGWGDMPMDLGARIGFSATGAFDRSAFGVGFGAPAPGSTLGVSDRVEVIIETEFTKARPAN